MFVMGTRYCGLLAHPSRHKNPFAKEWGTHCMVTLGKSKGWATRPNVHGRIGGSPTYKIGRVSQQPDCRGCDHHPTVEKTRPAHPPPRLLETTAEALPQTGTIPNTCFAKVSNRRR